MIPEGFNAIVTGGTKGIGLYIAEKLLLMRQKTLILYKSDAEGAKKAVKTLEAINGGNVNSFQCDVTNSNDILNLKLYLSATNSHPTILVNCAGFNKDALIWRMDDCDWDSVIDVTLKGAFNMCKLIVPYMRSQDIGVIINVSSVVPQVGVAGTSNYSAAKSGLFGFTKSLAKELAPKNIRVNTLALGYFNTGIINSVPTEHLDKIIEAVPLKRLGTNSDIGSAIEFLINCSFYTGQVLNVNGGLY